MREPVLTDGAPAAIGPYSQAIAAAGCVWASGQIGMDPASGALVEGGVEAETRRVLDNLRAVLEAAGTGLEKVIRATIYLTDLGDFEAVNRIYGEYFTQPHPARVCVQVSRLPRGACVEIDAVALAS
jgi:2-iminobutanoate/2-iminopropanoate deaminase